MTSTLMKVFVAISTRYWINVNGTIGAPGEGHISVLDRGFLYGDSVYEVTRTYNKTPLFMEDHLTRLTLSAERIYMPLQMGLDEITVEAMKTLEASGLSEAYIRIIITRGEGEISLDPNSQTKQNFVIICKEQKAYPDEWYEKGVRLAMSLVVRNAPDAMDPNIKSGNYLNNVLAFKAASEAGAHEAVMLNDKGEVTECTTSNIWIVKNGEIWTPPIKAGLLEGITRSKLLDLGKKHKLPMKEKLFYPKDILEADECFITSSTREVLPVTQVDDTHLSQGSIGPVTKKLLGLYQNLRDDYIKNY